jgi:hypothetical protein
MRNGLFCVALIAGVACGGSGESPDSPEVAIEAAAEASPISDEMLDRTWVVQMATKEAFRPYADKSGWVMLVVKRDYERAASMLDVAPGGMAAARVHADLSSLYKQAALLSANSLIQAYGETPEETDPVGTAHLLTVAYAINGDLDSAKAQSAKLADVADDPTLEWHAPWKAWLESGDTWPPDLQGLPFELPPIAVEQSPAITGLPHYALQEQGVDTSREMADPGSLIALALWHEALAAQLAGEAAPQVAVYGASYRLPIEAPVAASEALPMELLFGADLLVPEDGQFLAELHGPKGAAAVDTWNGKSLLATIAHVSRKDGKVDAELAVDLISDLRGRLLDRSKAKTNDTVEGHQRTFADIGFVGLLRSLALVAEVEGDREVSGRLRINALEQASDKSTACPTGLVALAAWDASNRYPIRALDIVHVQSRRFSSLEAARYGLDVMALRVSRERPGETAGM